VDRAGCGKGRGILDDPGASSCVVVANLYGQG